MAKIRTSLVVNEVTVPIDVYIERRSSLRVAFGKNAVIVRMPKSIGQSEQQKQYVKAKAWITDRVKEKPHLATNYLSDISTGSTIEVMGLQYEISVNLEDRKTASGQITNSSVLLKLPVTLEERDKPKLIKGLLSRVFAERHKKDIERRVIELNAQTVNQKIKSIRLKYNKSNWGSCSSQNNVNLSSRLLLVPADVRDYVIIHELCHLIEMNHSKAFWGLVERYDPNYKRHDEWLDVHGVKVDF